MDIIANASNKPINKSLILYIFGINFLLILFILLISSKNQLFLVMTVTIHSFLVQNYFWFVTTIINNVEVHSKVKEIPTKKKSTKSYFFCVAYGCNFNFIFTFNSHYTISSKSHSRHSSDISSHTHTHNT